MPTQPEPERHGTVRADKTAAWIELAGTRLALDGDRELWGGFADRDVIVTGVCHGDGSQFRVHTLRAADPTSGARGPLGLGAYLAVGPEQLLDGELTVVTAPPGSKLEGSSQTVFVADGTSYGLAGPYIVGLEPGRQRLLVRVLEPDMSYVARSLDHDVWIAGLDQPNAEPEPRPCPGD